MLRRILVMPIVYALLVMFAACAQPGALTPPPTAPLNASATASASPVVATPTPTAPGQAAGATRTPTTAPSDTPAGPTSTPVIETLDTQSTTTTSPDGAWVAVAAVSYPTIKIGVACDGCGDQYFARLTVHRADNSQAWTAIAEWRPMGLGAPVPAVLQWSADGVALYYTNVVFPDGCSVFANGTDLWRLDLATGRVAQLLPASGYWLSLSPDETQVAYLTYGQRGLVVHDLVTGAERAYALDDLGLVQPGAVVWSPDAAALALTVATDPCNAQTRLVMAVTLADGARRVLLQPNDRQLFTVAWPDADRVILVDPDGARWVLTISTGQVTPEG